MDLAGLALLARLDEEAPRGADEDAELGVHSSLGSNSEDGSSVGDRRPAREHR